MKQRLGVLFVIAAVALISGCTRIGPGHIGIKIDNAGSNKGVLDAPVKTGWVWYMPGQSSVVEYPTYVQTAKWTKDPNEGHPANEEVTFTNKDSMAISADVSLSYSLQAEKAPQFYVKFLSDDLDTFTHGFLRNVARDCFNEHAGKYSIEQIMGDNSQFILDTRKCVQDQVSAFGVNIEQFGFIGAPRPPNSVVEAINLKAQAQQIALQKTMELQQVQADANKSVARAEGQAKAQIAEANGEAEANRIRNQSITENILKMRALDNQGMAIQKWDGAMPHVLTSAGDKQNFLMQIPSSPVR
ncbi:MAG TPA: SPFH domain-containing protein [Candidatus Angelobacter sp.]|nr:SPFH domain-containing protein [Candidatus Angelobacter sp.]